MQQNVKPFKTKVREELIQCAEIYMSSGTKPDKAAYSIMLSHLFDASCEYITKHKDQVSKEAFQKLLAELKTN